MSTIVDTIQAIVRKELRSLRTAELGIVEAVHPHSDDGDQDNYACDVALRNSGLLLKRVPVATGHIGTVAIPNVGDLVLVVFDHGDVNQPLVVGRLYNDEDRPPLSTTDEIVLRLPLAEPDDQTIAAAIRNHPDRSPPREILVEMSPKITVRITDGTVRATAGKTEMTLDQPGTSGGRVTVVAGRTMITMDQDGDVSVEAAGAATLRATRELSLEAQNITLKSVGNTSVEAGGSASVKGGLEAKLEGGAAATVRGAAVRVNGLTSFSP